jgi:hypothetical protein
MLRMGTSLGVLLVAAACGTTGPDDNDSNSSGGVGGNAVTTAATSGDPNANSDGDCMTDGEEAMFGSDPLLADTDGDGHDDCKERDCGSNATDAMQKCYACGWVRNDPGTIVGTGTAIGDTMPNFSLVDQCGEMVSMYDFAGEYHILYMTAGY